MRGMERPATVIAEDPRTGQRVALTPKAAAELVANGGRRSSPASLSTGAAVLVAVSAAGLIAVGLVLLGRAG